MREFPRCMNLIKQIEELRQWPRVAILVLNWNGWRDTIECIESLQQLTYPNYDIVVIDNGSIDGSMDKIKNWAAGKIGVKSKLFAYNTHNEQVHFIEYDRGTAEAGGLAQLEAKIAGIPSSRRIVLIQTGVNLGFAGGNNVGMRYSLIREASYVWLLNNDTVVDENALTEMVQLSEREPQVGMVGSKLLYYDCPTRIQSVGGLRIGPSFIMGFRQPGSDEENKGQWESVVELYHIMGASLLAKREMITNIGLMDESYFFLCEELDWNVRARKRGWRLLYCPHSLIFHKGSKSIRWTSPLSDYYFMRNSLFFATRFYPYWLPLVFLRLMIRISKRLLEKEPKNVRAILDALWDFCHNKKGACNSHK